MNCEEHTSNYAHEDGDLTMSFQETSAFISDLPNYLLKHCFGFISGSYITIAPVSRRFFSSYSTIGIDDSDTVNSAETLLKIGKNKRTTADTVSTDLKLTEYCFTLDAPDKFMHKVCYKAIMKGRQDIFECGLVFGVDFEEVVGEDDILGDNSVIMQLVERGNLRMLEYLYRKFDTFFSRKDDFYWSYIFKAAGRKGQRNVVEWILQEKKSSITVYDAARTGFVDILQDLQQSNPIFDEQIFSKAAMSGSIEMLEYCLRNNCPYDQSLFYAAVENENNDQAMEILKWLQQHDIPMDMNPQSAGYSYQTIDPCGHASLHDNLPALKWARNKGCPWSAQKFQNAARNGNIEMLQYCLDNGCPKNEDFYFGTMEIDTLKWLQRHSFSWNKEIYRAAKGADAMDWAQDNGCPYDEDTIYRFILIGSISSIEKCLQSHDYPIDVEKAYDEVFGGFPRNNNSLIIEKLQLLRKYGYAWTANLCALAARRGNLRILQWLRHNGCSWDAKTCAGAVLSSNIEILKYAHENGCEWDKESYANCFAVYDGSYYPEPTEKIVLRECRDILEYLKKNNCPKPEHSDWNEKPYDVEFGIEIEDEDMPEDSDWNVVPDDVEIGT